MEDRKKEEIEYHNLIRGQEVESNPQKRGYYYSNMKYYEAARKTYEFQKEWLVERCKGKKVLVLGCGNGAETFIAAENGADAVGIDISDVAVENARKIAKEKGIKGKISFEIMDAENLKFNNNAFDIVTASGMLHHTNFEKVMAQINRVLKPNGLVFCIEPLAYNPVFQLYRKMTPHLRTKWEAEHIFSKKELKIAGKYFGKIEKKFLHLATLLAVPFRKTFIFKPLLWILEKIDSVLLRLPGIKWWAWQIIFILSAPKK